MHMMARLHHFLRAQAVSMGGQAKDMGEFKTIEEFLVWVSDLLTASVDIYAMLEKCFGKRGAQAQSRVAQVHPLLIPHSHGSHLLFAVQGV